MSDSLSHPNSESVALASFSKPPKHQRKRRPHPPRNPQATRIKNGAVIIAGVNQSVGYVRRLRELLADYLADRPQATTAERNQIRHACVLEIELEHLETKFATDGAATKQGLDLYQRTLGNHRRLLQALGLAHHTDRPKGKTLGEVLVADWEEQQREEHEKKQAAARALAGGAEKESDADAA